jgi:pyridoxal phosphate enzyme (YggS family)
VDGVLRANLEAVQGKIQRAAERAGRSPRDILLVAVSKTVDVEQIREAIEAGVNALGENRVQEAKEKIRTLGHPVPWHLVGSLQTNKVKEALNLFDVIHSVDRPSLARELDRRARASGRRVRVLVQLNLAQEATKGGVSPDELKPLMELLAECSGLCVCGLMTIPPPAQGPEDSRPWFRRLRELRGVALTWRLPGITLEHLSMGMSDDFEVAIEEGATMVRVGTAIFGPRRSA